MTIISSWLSESGHSVSAVTGLNEVQSYYLVIVATAVLLAGLLFGNNLEGTPF